VVQQRAKSAKLQILAYAPTEFFHCQHCEVVFQQIGLGSRIHAEQRDSGLLPPDLNSEYQAISDWIAGACERYGERLSISMIDAVSIEGVWTALRHRVRRFPAFIIDGDAVAGFDRERLDAELAASLGL
jgi:hypothetical protein